MVYCLHCTWIANTKTSIYHTSNNYINPSQFHQTNKNTILWSEAQKDLLSAWVPSTIYPTIYFYWDPDSSKKINQRKTIRVQKFIYVALHLYIHFTRCAFKLNFEIEESVFITIFFEDIIFFLLQIQNTSGIVR